VFEVYNILQVICRCFEVLGETQVLCKYNRVHYNSIIHAGQVAFTHVNRLSYSVIVIPMYKKAQ